ncbi:MAG: redox-sensing transcriptional repressor Rex [Polyangiaceae bacterium]|nr:redox-sensing transcriptional repressor Rex [Polyangiaceae bacterium]
MAPATKNRGVSPRLVERLSLYRRVLQQAGAAGARATYSHELAAACRVSAVQVRRDLMTLGHSGSTTSGYEIQPLLSVIDAYLGDTGSVPVALVGIGHLGRAVLAFLCWRHPRFVPVAFDRDPRLTERVLDGVWCFPIDRMADAIREQHIRVGVVCVPAPEAQRVSEQLVTAGVTGILNFAPVTLFLPNHVFVETIDISVALEKVAFFTR